MPTAWSLSLQECRAGIRRWSGTDLSAQYIRVLSHAGEGAVDPKPWQKTTGDMISPKRTGSATSLINLVSREMSQDVSSWRMSRILNMVAQIHKERRDNN